MLPKDTLIFTALLIPTQECNSSFMQDKHKHYWHPDLPRGCKAKSCAPTVMHRKNKRLFEVLKRNTIQITCKSQSYFVKILERRLLFCEITIMDMLLMSTTKSSYRTVSVEKRRICFGMCSTIVEMLHLIKHQRNVNRRVFSSCWTESYSGAAFTFFPSSNWENNL